MHVIGFGKVANAETEEIFNLIERNLCAPVVCQISDLRRLSGGNY